MRRTSFFLVFVSIWLRNDFDIRRFHLWRFDQNQNEYLFDFSFFALQIQTNVSMGQNVPMDNVLIQMEVSIAVVIQALLSILSIRYIVKVKTRRKRFFIHLLFSDIDECAAFDHCTNDNEICENTIGSFRCGCARGYRRDVNQRCISKIQKSIIQKKLFSSDIDECAESNSICDNNSRCEDRPGSFACCMTRFTDRCIGKRSMKSNENIFFRRFRMWF